MQGDVVAIVDANKEIVVEYLYDAWGRLLTTGGTKATDLGVHNPLRYRGYVYDPESGLYYLQSRYYNPALGRFISSDVYTSTGQGLTGNNMFAYCGNNPVTRSDAGGNWWDTIGDLVSLALSVYDVVQNPDDLGAWIGLVLDVADVALPYVGGLGELVKAGSATLEIVDNAHDTLTVLDEFEDGIKYTDKVLHQMENSSDLYHAFPAIIDQLAETTPGKWTPDGDGVARFHIELPGSINGNDGIFEYIIDPSGWCNHRLFKETK